MTNAHPVSLSISPADSSDVAPLCGTESKEPYPEWDDKREEDRDIQVGPSAEATVEAPVVAEDDEEMRRPKVARRPELPTKAEVEEHFPLHLQYRSWCKHCRYGKAKLAPHSVEPSDRETAIAHCL